MPLLGTCSWGDGWLNHHQLKSTDFSCSPVMTHPDPLLYFESQDSSFPVLFEIRQIITLHLSTCY